MISEKEYIKYVMECSLDFCKFGFSLIPKVCSEKHQDGENCPICESAHPLYCFKGFWAIQNTKYVDEEENWFFGCEKCHEENDEHWQEMWNEYHSGLF